MNRLTVSVDRFDGYYVIRASDRDLEHTHRHRFPTTTAGEAQAHRIAERIRAALQDGRDLDLRHWKYTGP